MTPVAQTRRYDLPDSSATDESGHLSELHKPYSSVGATGGIESLNAFFLLLDKPEVYNLPEAPPLP